MTAWELAEHEHDMAREADRPRRHLTMQQRREHRFWPPMFALITAGAITLTAAIEGGAL